MFEKWYLTDIRRNINLGLKKDLLMNIEVRKVQSSVLDCDILVEHLDIFSYCFVSLSSYDLRDQSTFEC